MEAKLYELRDKGSEQDYSSWVDSPPNLQTYLTAINQSQPITQCQYELVWSRWPRTLFFTKSITIPGVSVNTVDLNHAGFTVKIPTHVTYETTEITLSIMADKEGFHYYDLRNMVLQTGHPLVAGDPRSTVGNQYGLSPDEDTLEIRLRNKPDDIVHHHWILHNFKPTGLGELELGVENASFVQFEITGTFTHITYDCGYQDPSAATEEDAPVTALVLPSPPPETTPNENPAETAEQPTPDEGGGDDEEEGGEDQPTPTPDKPKKMPPDGQVIVAQKMREPMDFPSGARAVVDIQTNSSIGFGVDSRDGKSPSQKEVKLANKYADKMKELDQQLKDEITQALKNTAPTRKSNLPEAEWSISGAGMSQDMDAGGEDKPLDEQGKNDNFSSNTPKITVTQQPPPNDAQKKAIEQAMNNYNQKMQNLAKEYKQEKKELQQHQQDKQDFEDKF